MTSYKTERTVKETEVCQKSRLCLKRYGAVIQNTSAIYMQSWYKEDFGYAKEVILLVDESTQSQAGDIHKHHTTNLRGNLEMQEKFYEQAKKGIVQWGVYRLAHGAIYRLLKGEIKLLQSVAGFTAEWNHKKQLNALNEHGYGPYQIRSLTLRNSTTYESME